MSKFGVDVRHPQDIEHVLGWLPVIRYPLGFSAVFQAGGVLGPLDADVLDELGVKFLGRGAPFPPVEDKLGNGLLDKIAIDSAALHDLHGIQARAPAVIQCGFFRGAKSLGLMLLLAAPVTGHVLAKFVFPGMASFAALAPVKDEIFQLVQGELPRYVVVQAQQLQQVLAGRPVYGQ